MLAYFAIILVALLGFSGLVADVGRFEVRSLQMQAAADNAALSATAEYGLTGTLSGATAAANAELAAFGSLNGITAPTATVSLGATSGSYQNDNSTLQVKVTGQVPTTLLSLVKGGVSNVNVSATAVAMLSPCAYLMGNPSIQAGYSFNLWLASQGLHLPCPMYSTQGYLIDYFSNLNGSQAKESASVVNYAGGSASPAIIMNAPVLADPLAYVASPAFSSCNTLLTAQSYPVSQTIAPGTYCGNLTVTGSTTTVTMSPGLYIITGYLSVTAGATLTGTGVTIFLTKGGGYNYGGFQLNNSTFKVDAPTDNSAGGRPAIVMMTDRAWSLSTQDIYMYNSTFKSDGILYITGTGIYSWNNQISGTHYFSFVAANFYSFASGITLSNDYSVLPGGNPFHTGASLVQ